MILSTSDRIEGREMAETIGIVRGNAARARPSSVLRRCCSATRFVRGYASWVFSFDVYNT